MKKEETHESEVMVEEPQEAPSASQPVQTDETVQEEPLNDTAASASEAEKATAKAGKRSAKAIKEAEEVAAKEARKATGDTSPLSEEAAAAQKRGQTPIPRPRIERRGKAYRKVAEQIDRSKLYTLEEALKTIAKTSPTKFDATVEIHLNLGVDTRQAEQNIRATVTLPHGTGKRVRVAVFAPSDQLEAADKAGADIAGENEFLERLDKEDLAFDVLISTPQMMPRIAKYARLLGPRGLMPNPKSGTVTTNIAKAVKEAKAGRIEYRADKQGIVHQGIGKVSFTQSQLLENATAFVASIKQARPANLKSTYLKSAALSTTMGPSVRVDLTSL